MVVAKRVRFALDGEVAPLERDGEVLVSTITTENATKNKSKAKRHIVSPPPPPPEGGSLGSTESDVSFEYSSDEEEETPRRTKRSSLPDFQANRPPKTLQTTPKKRQTETALKLLSHRRVSSAPSVFSSEELTMDALMHNLEELRGKFGPEHPLVAKTCNLIGNAHFRRKDYRRALRSYKEAVKCGVNHQLGDAYANLGTVYWTIGKVDEAIAFLERAHQVHEFNLYRAKKDPATSMTIATVHYQRGLAFTLKGSFDEAMIHLKECERIRKRQLGSDHIDVARALDAMGKACMLRGDYPAALCYHEQALAIKKKHADARGDPALLLPTLHSISVVQRLSGQTEASMSTYGTISKIQKVEGLPVPVAM